MGFLKFLKREKKEDALESLDLPPAPPSMDDFDDKLPEMPEFPELNEKIPAPEFPKFDFNEEKIPQMDDKLASQDFPEMEEDTVPIEPISMPQGNATQPLPQPMPEHEEIASQQEEMQLSEPIKTERRLFRHKIRRESLGRKEVYVRVDKFKAMLQSISMMRSDLRKSEEALLKLENIKNAKDRSYERVKSSISDLQNKLIFVDKTLFRGD